MHLYNLSISQEIGDCSKIIKMLINRIRTIISICPLITDTQTPLTGNNTDKRTDGWTDGQTDATKCIISLASRSIIKQNVPGGLIFSDFSTMYN